MSDASQGSKTQRRVTARNGFEHGYTEYAIALKPYLGCWQAIKTSSLSQRLQSTEVDFCY